MCLPPTAHVLSIRGICFGGPPRSSYQGLFYFADLDLDEFRIARLEDLAIRHCSWFASAAGRCGDEKRQRDRRKHGSGEARAESKTKGRMRSFHRMDSTRTFRDWFRGAGANCGEVTRGAIAASMRA